MLFIQAGHSELGGNDGEGTGGNGGSERLGSGGVGGVVGGVVGIGGVVGGGGSPSSGGVGGLPSDVLSNGGNALSLAFLGFVEGQGPVGVGRSSGGWESTFGISVSGGPLHGALLAVEPSVLGVLGDLIATLDEGTVVSGGEESGISVVSGLVEGSILALGNLGGKIGGLVSLDGDVDLEGVLNDASGFSFWCGESGHLEEFEVKFKLNYNSKIDIGL